MSDRQRIHFVEFNAKVNSLALVKVFPKYGTPLLATILRDRGYDVQIYLEGVSDMRFATLADCDLVCLPVFAPAYNKVRAFVEKLRAEKPSLPVVLGGPQAILYPETLLPLGAHVVRCEGDEVLPELVERLLAGGDTAAIAGVSVLRDGAELRGPDRPPPAIPTTVPDLELIDGIDAALAGSGRHWALQNTLQTSRGCTYRCRFCPTNRLFGGSCRNRDVDSIIAEMRHKLRYNDLFFVVDNNFFNDRERSVALLHRIAREDLGAQLIIFARQEIGRDRELLTLLRRAGVVCLIVGVESLTDDTLQAFNKQQRTADVMRSIEEIRRSGIHVIATFAFGFDGDTPARAQQIVRFVQQHELALNVFLLHDIEQDAGKRLLIPLERRFVTHYMKAAADNTDYYDYATGNFVTYYPKQMKPSTLQRCYLDMYRQLYTDRHILRSVLARSAFESLFGVTHGYGIRRLNEAVERVVDSHYLAHLQRLEQGLYDSDEQLLEDRLAALEGLPLPRPLQDQVDLASYETQIKLAAAPGMVRHLANRAQRRVVRQMRSLPGLRSLARRATG